MLYCKEFCCHVQLEYFKVVSPVAFKYIYLELYCREQNKFKVKNIYI
jgi:hypothetical protein